MGCRTFLHLPRLVASLPSTQCSGHLHCHRSQGRSQYRHTKAWGDDCSFQETMSSDDMKHTDTQRHIYIPKILLLSLQIMLQFAFSMAKIKLLTEFTGIGLDVAAKCLVFCPKRHNCMRICKAVCGAVTLHAGFGLLLTQHLYAGEYEKYSLKPVLMLLLHFEFLN